MAHIFTLGGKTNEDLGIIMKNTPRQALPEVISRMEENANRPGSYDFEGEYGELVFELECAFEETGNESVLQSEVRDLTDHLTDEDGKPRDLSLIFQEEPNLSYTVRYDGSGMDVGRGLASDQGDFTLNLIAVDPRAKGPEETQTNTVSSSPETVEITNDGNVTTPMVIKITNKGSSAVSGITLEQL